MPISRSSGTPVGEICRKLGVSEQSFYRWKKRFGALGVSELRELAQLREENRKLKGLVADLSLDKTILHERLVRPAARSSTGRGRRTRCPSAGPAAPCR
jgi:putative transposase